MGDLLANRGTLRNCGKYAIESIEGQSHDEIVKEFGSWLAGSNDLDAIRFGREGIEGVAEMENATTRMNVIAGRVVEISKGDGGNSHLARAGRFHRLANDL